MRRCSRPLALAATTLANRLAKSATSEAPPADPEAASERAPPTRFDVAAVPAAK